MVNTSTMSPEILLQYFPSLPIAGRTAPGAVRAGPSTNTVQSMIIFQKKDMPMLAGFSVMELSSGETR
jgi:hypothetical protein